MISSKISKPNGHVVGIACSFFVLLLLGWVWINVGGTPSKKPVAVAEKASEQPSNSSEISSAPESDLQSLTTVELASGFRIMQNPENGGNLFVHPNSPCWLELPSSEVSETGRSETQQSDLPPTSELGSAPNAFKQQPPNQWTEPSTVTNAGTDSWSDFSDFVGPQECLPCHRQKYVDFLETAHYKSSNPASSLSIDGSFEEGENRLDTNHPDLHFEMTQDAGSFYQEVHFRDLQRRVRFDIVTGSGKSAQTYLYWAGDRLYQMHVSYFKPLESWINSPGFHDGTAWFTRETIPKCVQCHMTYMEWIPGTVNRFQRENVVFGVTCERCHGPGQAHVEFHLRNPSEKTARFIANPADLSADRSNDVCAQCHLGTATPLQEPFSFRPGDSLSDHFELHPEDDGKKGVVHTANQLERMKKSACYLESDSLTCASCHNPHRNEHGKLKLFSTRCLQCHEVEHCGMSSEIGGSIKDNCIDCHMSMGYDDHIRLETPDTVHMPLLRDHFIRILPDATQRFLENGPVRESHAEGIPAAD